MRLRDVLDPQRHAACTAAADGTVAAAVLSMTTGGRSACVVIDNGSPVGIFTAGDLIRCLPKGGSLGGIPVRSVMSENPLVAGVDKPAMVAADDMMRRGIHHLPVMDGGVVVGVLRLADIAAAVIDALQGEMKTLEGYIADMHAARDD
ncbi:MAG: CBS domain-containing protein [Pseudomonadota bacterium]